MAIEQRTQSEILQEAKDISYAEVWKKRFAAKREKFKDAYLAGDLLAALVIGVFMGTYTPLLVMLSFVGVAVICVFIAVIMKDKSHSLPEIFTKVIMNSLYPAIATCIITSLPAALLSSAVLAVLSPILFWGMVALPVVFLIMGLVKEHLLGKGSFIDFFDNPLYKMFELVTMLTGFLFVGIAVIVEAGGRACFPERNEDQEITETTSRLTTQLGGPRPQVPSKPTLKPTLSTPTPSNNGSGAGGPQSFHSTAATEPLLPNDERSDVDPTADLRFLD